MGNLTKGKRLMPFVPPFACFFFFFFLEASAWHVHEMYVTRITFPFFGGGEEEGGFFSFHFELWFPTDLNLFPSWTVYVVSAWATSSRSAHMKTWFVSLTNLQA